MEEVGSGVLLLSADYVFHSNLFSRERKKGPIFGDCSAVLGSIQFLATCADRPVHKRRQQ